MKFWLSLSIGIVFFISTLRAQSDRIEFRHLSIQDGLPGNTVLDVKQDIYGFLWIGTNEGLSRYDGYQFINYQTNENDSNSLSGNFSYSICIDAQNQLWIGTNNGLCLYDYENNEFERHQHIETDENSLGSDYIRKVYADTEGNIWIGRWGGFSRFNPETKKFSNYNLDITNGLPIGNMAICFLEKENNSIWIGTHGGGLLKFDKNTEKYQTFQNNPSSSSSLGNNHVTSLYVDNKDNFWVGTWGGGISLFDESSETFTKHFHSNENDPNSISHNQIKSIIQDNKGQVWIGTEDGINLFHPENQTFTSWSYQAETHTSLSRKVVQVIYQDNAGIFWVGTYGGGLNYFKLKPDAFVQYYFTEKNSTELQSNVSTALLALDENTILYGNEKGLSLFDRNSQQFNAIPLPPADKISNPSFNGISAIFKDSKDQIWIGYDGLIKLNKNYQVIQHYKHIKNDRTSLFCNKITAIDEDQNGNLWISTQEGLSFFDIKKGGFTNYLGKDLSNRIDSPDFRIVKFNQTNNTLWLLTYGRVIVLDESLTAKAIYESQTFSDSPILKGVLPTSIVFEDHEKVWIGTEKGLQLINFITGENIKHFTQADGLCRNAVTALIKDENNNLWIGTDRGITKYNNENQTFLSFLNTGDVQPEDKFISSIAATKSGELLIGSYNGFHVFDPDKAEKIKKSQTIFISEYKEYKSSIPIEKTHFLYNTLNSNNALILSHKNRIISFELAANDFSEASSIKYAYKLEGYQEFENEWIYTKKNERKISFMNIPSGNYTFKVIGITPSGATTNEIIIPIIVRSSVWNSLWFRLLAILGIIVLIYVVYKLRQKGIKTERSELQLEVKKHSNLVEDKNKLLVDREEEITIQSEKIKEQHEVLEQQHHELEKLVEQRTAELEKAMQKAKESDKLKTAFLENLSHELRTPMNGILGFSSLITERKISDEDRKEYLKIIQSSTSQLLTLIEDIVELSKLESKQMMIKETEFDLNKLMDELYKTFLGEKIKRDKDHLQLELHKYFDGPCMLTSDETRLRQILTYMLRNGIKFTMEGGVNFGYELKDENTLQFYVRDTGIGIKKEKQEIIFDRFRQVDDENSRQYGGTGLGLAISKGLLELFDGHIWLQSEPEKGSTFYFTIPFKPSNNKDFYEKVKNRNRFGLNSNFENRTILIVEDEEQNYSFLKEVLSSSNANLIHAKTGKEAVEYCKSNETIDMVLMDIKLPDISGLDATKQIRMFRKELPIIAQTAYALARDKEKCLAAGCNDYITKPIDKTNLFNKINHFM